MSDKNASLLLTKQMERTKPFKSMENRKRWEKVLEFTASSDYERAYLRWKQRIEALPGVTSEKFAVASRLLVGSGNASVLMNGLTLNRMWGMPLIPGSSLKGLAAHYAASLPDGRLDECQRRVLFGELAEAGFITWFDAWWVPDAISPFLLDVVTPHHGKYYQKPAPGSVRQPPWDFDDPIPSNFVTVRGSFLVALRAPDELWAEQAMILLRHALEEWGVGGKTSSGYGRLKKEDILASLGNPSDPETATQSVRDTRAPRKEEHHDL